MTVNATHNVKKRLRSASNSALQATARRLFRQYKDQFFPGLLSEYHVRVKACLSPVELTPLMGYCDMSNKTIYIQAKTARNKKQLSQTLLHEMAHAVTGGGHTDKWRAEIARLQAAGAPICPSDLTLSSKGESEEWPVPVSVIRDFIESASRNFLENNPDTDPSKFLHWLIREHPCDVSSQAALLRRYPWVWRVFHKTERKNRKELAENAAFQQKLQMKTELA